MQGLVCDVSMGFMVYRVQVFKCNRVRVFRVCRL